MIINAYRLDLEDDIKPVNKNKKEISLLKLI